MTRDMTDAEFIAALKRNHFRKPSLFWCEDLQNEGHHYGMIVDRKGHIYKRQTIAHLLASRKETERQKATIPLNRVQEGRV